MNWRSVCWVHIDATFFNKDVSQISIPNRLVLLYHLHKRRVSLGLLLIELSFFGLVLFPSEGTFLCYCIVPLEYLFLQFCLLVQVGLVRPIILIGLLPECDLECSSAHNELDPR